MNPKVVLEYYVQSYPAILFIIMTAVCDQIQEYKSSNQRRVKFYFYIIHFHFNCVVVLISRYGRYDGINNNSPRQQPTTMPLFLKFLPGGGQQLCRFLFFIFSLQSRHSAYIIPRTHIYDIPHSRPHDGQLLTLHRLTDTDTSVF